LNVCKGVDNLGQTTFQPSDFTFVFTTPADPSTFPGSGFCTDVIVAPGTFTFTESFPPNEGIVVGTTGACEVVGLSGNTATFEGTIAEGETLFCFITNIFD
jgi:hypothetical protein